MQQLSEHTVTVQRDRTDIIQNQQHCYRASQCGLVTRGRRAKLKWKHERVCSQPSILQGTLPPSSVRGSNPKWLLHILHTNTFARSLFQTRSFTTNTNTGLKISVDSTSTIEYSTLDCSRETVSAGSDCNVHEIVGGKVIYKNTLPTKYNCLTFLLF